MFFQTSIRCISSSQALASAITSPTIVILTTVHTLHFIINVEWLNHFATDRPSCLLDGLFALYLAVNEHRGHTFSLSFRSVISVFFSEYLLHPSIPHCNVSILVYIGCGIFRIFYLGYRTSNISWSSCLSNVLKSRGFVVPVGYRNAVSRRPAEDHKPL